MLSCLFLAALCSPDGKELTSWLSCVFCLLVTFPYGFPSQVWYLIVSVLIFAFFSTLLDALHANQQLFSHVGIVTWVEPVQIHSFTKNNLNPNKK